MTQLLDEAFEAARVAPPEIQDELARVLLSYLGGERPRAFVLTREDEGAIEHSRGAFHRGEIASDEEVAAIWAKHGL